MSTQTSQTQSEAPQEPIHYTESERAAMRAYVQRTEVRLSTLHRIATAFINGAGLLILMPFFLRDHVVTVLTTFIANIHMIESNAVASDQLIFVIITLLLFYPFLLSITIPIYSFYLLIKDIIHFYFTIYSPGFPASLFTPSFVLSGITFSPDESKRAKEDVFRYQYNNETIDFMIPFSGQKRERYFDESIRNTHGEIIPKTRKYEDLLESGVLPENHNPQMVQWFNAAMGIARTTDRRLSEEVATLEVSIVRHVLYLRRLVLRYVKALAMFVWTTLITFAMVPFLEDPRVPNYLTLSIAYLVWSLFVMKLMTLPLTWIYRHRHNKTPKDHIDRQLIVLEQQVKPFCYLAIVTSLIALILSLTSNIG